MAFFPSVVERFSSVGASVGAPPRNSLILRVSVGSVGGWCGEPIKRKRGDGT